MTLADLGNIGEFVGAIAVIVSLLYLAFQIRQNTRALHSSSYAQAAEQAWLVNLAVAQDAELARIVADAMEGRPLDPQDELRYRALFDNSLFAMENLFRQYERGLLDSDTWDNVVANGIAATPPAVWNRWQGRTGPLSQRLQRHLRERGIPGAPPNKALQRTGE
jgi:hypothetical protein